MGSKSRRKGSIHVGPELRQMERGLPAWGEDNGEMKGYDEGVGGHEEETEQGIVYKETW